MKRYDLNLLAALDALLRERSVSGAAKRLGIGQPAMSAALARLRALFGDELLVRGVRGMQPTPRALSLAEPLQRTLSDLRALVEPTDAFDAATVTRTFRIAGGDYAGMVLLPPLARLVSREAPGIDLRFRFVEKDMVPPCLEDGRIDLALLVTPGLAKRFEVEPLFEETFTCAVRVGHPVLGRVLDAPTFAALDHLLVTERGDERGRVDELLEQAGLSRRIALTVPGAALVAETLRTTDLIATIPRRAARRIAADGSIALVEPPVDAGSWQMSMAWLNRNSREPGLTWLREQLKSISRSLDVV